MSRKRQFNTKILSKGVMDPSLHYGVWFRVWWETVHLKLEDQTKNFVIPYRLYMIIECDLNNLSFIIYIVQSVQNPLKSGFQCTCNTIKSNVESNLLAAIKTCYQKVFGTKTEYSGQAVMGFEYEIIIQQLIDDVEFFPIFLQIENFNVIISSIGDLDENKFYGVGAGFVSSFTARYRSAQHLFVLKIEENQCNLEIYLESDCTNQIIGQTPDDVWKKVGIHKKHTRSYIFGVTDELVREHIEMLKNKSPKCTPNDWVNFQQLEKVFNRHIKSRKIPNAMTNWQLLFYKWYQQKSSIIQFPLILEKIYTLEYNFQEKELRAWWSIFVACGCTNVTPVPKKESLIEFWSKAPDPTADKELLETLYNNGTIQLNKAPQNLQPKPNLEDSTFWDSFQVALFSNKKGFDGKIHILSIIAQKFTYSTLRNKLGISNDSINSDRKHAQLYGPGAPLLQKPKRTASRLTDIQENQFLLKAKCGKKFNETYPDGMKRTSFMARLADSKNLKFCENLGGLCIICNDYGYDTFDSLANIIRTNFTNKNLMVRNIYLILIIKAKHRRGYEEELIVREDGCVEHNPCISHYLPYAFGECVYSHETQCPNCDELFNFLDFIHRSVPSNDFRLQIEESKEKLLYYLSYQTRKVYLNAQFKATLVELNFDSALFIADYKMRILPESAHKTKREFFRKRGWTLHTILVFTKIKKDNQLQLDVKAYNHWSTDIKQDAWFTALAFEFVFEAIEKWPKWIKVISDNGPHYHNSELMSIVGYWHEWYGIEVHGWLFLEPGEAKTAVDSHHAAIKHAITRYLRIGHDLATGDDISQAVKNLSGTTVANIEPDRDDNDDEKWSIGGRYNGYISTCPLPNIGEWNNFSPAYLNKLWNVPLHRPNPTKSEHTIPSSTWTIPINNVNDYEEVRKRLKIKDNINVDQGDKSESQKEIINIVISIPRCGIPINQEVGAKRQSEDRMDAQTMHDELLKYVEAGDIEAENIPKTSTIQNWLNTYARAFKRRATIESDD
ncbi:hypothetical protein C2G38_2197242 [Gigaspora rosea]|uniref:Uncharacterized protein n=1 Tax=Gigaspora rosea TaxID=44941 RepID=A0A397UTV4_9GLOM|nr:hypothetical protein C2G38_2197242 [Gigaspora rosea]